MEDNTGTAEAEKAEAPSPEFLEKYGTWRQAEIDPESQVIPYGSGERRRGIALQIAAETFGEYEGNDAEAIVKYAKVFDAFLKGE